jgi:hypothetical protein
MNPDQGRRDIRIGIADQMVLAATLSLGDLRMAIVGDHRAADAAAARAGMNADEAVTMEILQHAPLHQTHVWLVVHRSDHDRSPSFAVTVENGCAAGSMGQNAPRGGKTATILMANVSIRYRAESLETDPSLTASTVCGIVFPADDGGERRWRSYGSRVLLLTMRSVPASKDFGMPSPVAKGPGQQSEVT